MKKEFCRKLIDFYKSERTVKRSMSDIAEKLDYLEETKTLIMQALTAKGASITSDTTFREYANAVVSLPSISDPMSQQEYDSLETKDPNTLYLITEG